MTKTCQQHEIEIAAAGEDDLAEQVQEHIQTCPSCAELRAATLALRQSARPGATISEGEALALARGAVGRDRGQRAPLWALPLLSASASAAALILYFGMVSAEPAEVAISQNGEARDQPSSYVVQTVGEAEATPLPDSLKSVSEMLLLGSKGETEQ